MLKAPTYDDILLAAENIREKTIESPLVKLNWKTNDDVNIYLKLENLQEIGSFKVRAAGNAVTSLRRKHKDLSKIGVVTASAGNFGQGLAWYCREYEIPCTCVVPSSAPKIKIEGMKRLGAKIIYVPYSKWWEIIETHQCEDVAPKSGIFVHPGAENSVLAGNATIALEIIDSLPNVDCILAPYGSGALVTGIACGTRAILREKNMDENKIRVVACEPDTASPFALSMRNGKPTKFEKYQASFVDGCGGKAVLPKVWNLARDNIDQGVAVPLQKIKDAICILLERNHIVAEGAGACTVAAALSSKNLGKNIVCVVSGGGLDTNLLIDFLQDSSVLKNTKKKGSSVISNQKSTSRRSGFIIAAAASFLAASAVAVYYSWYMK